MATGQITLLPASSVLEVADGTSIRIDIIRGSGSHGLGTTSANAQIPYDGRVSIFRDDTSTENFYLVAGTDTYYVLTEIL